MSLERKMNRALARKNGTGGKRVSRPGSIGRNVRKFTFSDGYRLVQLTYHNRKGWR